MSTAPPPLAADLTDGLKRLKLAAMRRLAPELLITAKTSGHKVVERAILATRLTLGLLQQPQDTVALRLLSCDIAG